QKEFMNLYKAMSLAFNNLPESEKQTALKILPPPPSAEMYKLENGKLVKKQDVPPPPPPLETALPQNPSKELLEAKKKFLEKANIYEEAMQVYFKKKKGDLSDLRKMYDHVMVLYNEYSDLRKKENALPPPPPPVKK